MTGTRNTAARAAVALAVAVAVFAVLAGGCSTSTKQPSTESKTVSVAMVGAADMLKQLASGDIDGFIAWEPFPTAAVKDGSGTLLMESGKIWPDHPCCVLAVTSKSVDPAIQEALAWANTKATAWMNDPKNADKLVAYAAEFTGRPAEVVSVALKNIRYADTPNEKGLQEYYAQLAKYQLLKKTLSQLGFADEAAFFASYVDKRPFEAEKKDTPAAIAKAVAKSGAKVRITNIAGDMHHLAKFVAVKEGFYKQVGLVVGKNLIEVAPYPNGAAIMEAFKNGQIDAAYLGGAPATLKRINDDTKISVIEGVNDIGSALVVSKTSGITTPEGLAGKTIAVPAPGTVQDVLLRRLLDSLGLKYQLKG